MTTHKKKYLRTCPQCGKKTFVVSIFGSICSDEKCFYEGKETEKYEGKNGFSPIEFDRYLTSDELNELYNNGKSFLKTEKVECNPEGVGEWEEEFNERFKWFFDNQTNVSLKETTTPTDIKSFISTLLLQEKAKWKGEENWNKHKIMEWSNENSIRAYKVYDEDPNVWVIKVEDLQKRIDKLI